MSHGVKTLCLVLLLGSALVVAGCRRKKESHDVRDLNVIRVGLREQVASGDLTREEAVARLAEATKEAKFGSREKNRAKKKAALSPELEALGKDLKERAAKGELTAEEARAAWAEAIGKSKEQSNTKETGASTKGKE